MLKIQDEQNLEKCFDFEYFQNCCIICEYGISDLCIKQKKGPIQVVLYNTTLGYSCLKRFGCTYIIYLSFLLYFVGSLCNISKQYRISLRSFQNFNILSITNSFKQIFNTYNNENSVSYFIRVLLTSVNNSLQTCRPIAHCRTFDILFYTQFSVQSSPKRLQFTVSIENRSTDSAYSVKRL